MVVPRAEGQRVWWGSRVRRLFGLDPSKPRWPQIISPCRPVRHHLGGPLLGLVTINHCPFLIQDRTLYIGGLGSIIFWFLASFVVPHWRRLMRAPFSLVDMAQCRWEASRVHGNERPLSWGAMSGWLPGGRSAWPNCNAHLVGIKLRRGSSV
jgi:hypothetical protein